LALLWQYIISCLVLRTIGAKHKHDMCEALTRHVRSNNTSAKSKKKGLYGYDNGYKERGYIQDTNV